MVIAKPIGEALLMAIDLNLSTVISSTISSVINAIAILVATRWVGKALERVEKNGKDKDKNQEG